MGTQEGNAMDPGNRIAARTGLALQASQRSAGRGAIHELVLRRGPAGPALKTLFAEFEKRNPNVKWCRDGYSAERVPSSRRPWRRDGARYLHGHAAQRAEPDQPRVLHQSGTLMKAEKENIKARFTKEIWRALRMRR